LFAACSKLSYSFGVKRLLLTQVFLFWVVGFGTLSWLIRKLVARLVSKTGLPRVVNYYILVTPITPIVCLEEALTIEIPYFWGILPRLLAAYILFLPLFLLQRYSRISALAASLLFGAFGCFNEFILVGRINQIDNWLVLTVMLGLCFLIYAIMAWLPSYYLGTTVER
jgi:hypothetical protein